MTDEITNIMSKPEESGRDPSDPATIDREELRKLYEESCAGIKEGAIVKGKIIKVTDGEVYVDIGYKSEGVVSLSEFSDLEAVEAGQEVDVFLESVEDADGMVVLSRIRAQRQKKWDETILRSKEGDVVRGKITRKVRGGVIVDIGMDAFLPASQIDIRHVSSIDEYIGRDLEYKIIKINTDRKNIVLSRRELLEEERARNRETLLAEIEVGQTREGVVKNITDFGAFIDLCGMDGLLHITDITWGRINHPSEVLSVGDKIEVMVLDFDREKQRIALGLKQKQPSPWEDIESKYPVGSIVKGKIVNIVPYGAFFEIEKGIEGLIHISEMSWTKRINHPSEIISVGDEVEAMVLNIRKGEAKISLGIKQTEFNPWSVVEEKYPPGSHIRGKVRNITSYGAFVELEEGIDGLIHISDMSWTRKINHPTEVLKKGEITEAMVLAVDQEAKKITLGLKQLEENPWETIDQFIQVGTVVDAEVTKIADFGVFATIENGIECLIHISQLSEKPFQAIEDIVKTGDKVRAKVDRIDKQRRKIALSIKEYQRDMRVAEEEAAMEAAKAVSLGDESIAGMKEHIEQAMEQLSSSPEAEPAPAEAETSEAGKEAEAPPAPEGQPIESWTITGEPEEPTGISQIPPEEGQLEEEPPAEELPGEPITPEPPAAEPSVEPEVAPPTEEQPVESEPYTAEPEPPANPQVPEAEEDIETEEPAPE
ncbi:30S ribosomal protein S1, partial [bacterium]|nr:30S ribosomal protein S1 [bacterium]